MKLIIRADDAGYTDVCNIGAFEPIDNGVVTSADVMLDCSGTEDALRRLREHRIELVNLRDALYGTHGYKNHLRAVGGELYIG